MPDHVRFVGGQGFVTVSCGTCNSVTTPALSLRDDAERIDAWLREHAHGSPETPEPAEAPCVDDCCAATGPARLAAELSRVIHEFAEDLPWPDSQRLGADAARAVWAAGTTPAVPAPVLSRDVPIPLSESVEANTATEGRTEALRADVALTLAESLKGSTEEDFFRAADALIADFGRRGWRPPPCECLPFDICEKCWGPEQQHESQMRQLAYCEEIIPCGPEDADQCQNLRQPGSVHCAQHQPSPLPADEVEWGYRRVDDPESYTRRATGAIYARHVVASREPGEWVACKRRPAGPWVAVVEPVEPKPEPVPPPPPLNSDPGDWKFHGYDQMGLPTWSWAPVEPKETP